MYQPILVLATPLLNPTNRIRMHCLLLLTTLVVAQLYRQWQPDLPSLAPLPWAYIVHAIEYGGLAALAWVVMGGRSPAGAVLLAGSIALLDEGMQHYPAAGRTAGFEDVLAALIGAAGVVLVLRAMQSANVSRQMAETKRPADGDTSLV